MDNETAKSFYANYDWFRKFFQDLHDLVRGDIAEALKPLGYDDNWPGFTKERDRPTMPEYFQVAFYGQRKGRPGLQISALLKREWDNREIPSGEPHLMLVLHDEESNNTEITPRILRRQGVESFDPPGASMHFKGKLNWPVNFHGFFVPLDAFSEEQIKVTRVEMVVQERIVKPLRTILDEHFSNPGKKPKSGV